MPMRDEMWAALEGDFDLLIVGGGINGAGIARDAAQRGLRVAMVEMSDIASGTSSRSSKLVHGGLRYLEMYEFGLVFEAVSERKILLDLAPHLVNPLGFLFPVYKGARRGLSAIKAGLLMYEGLSLFRSPKRHRNLKPADVASEEPTLKLDDLKGAPLYYDCSTDDARLTLENALAAAADGAVVATYARVVAFEKEDGRIVGARIRDQFSGEERVVRASAVINATGPWTDRTIGMSRKLDGGALLRPTKGVHIVVARDVLPVEHAVVCFHPEDKRVLFALPWGDSTYVGTTDTDFEGDPADVAATRDDVDYLIAAAAFYFPSNPIRHSDVTCTWAGLRPLMRPAKKGGDVDESAVSREHQIVVGQDGLITIAGGKLTTYRLMSREVVESAVKMLRLTEKLPEGIKPSETESSLLPGAEGWPESDDHELVAGEVQQAAGGNIDGEAARLLANTYGMRAFDVAAIIKADPALGRRILPHRPEVVGQIDFSVTEEFAVTVRDVIKQRTQIFYRDADQGLGCVEAVAARMAMLLGWDEATREQRIAHYREEVALSRRWQNEAPSV